VKKYLVVCLTVIGTMFFVIGCASLCPKPVWASGDKDYGVLSVSSGQIVLYGIGDGIGDIKVAEANAKNKVRDAGNEMFQRAADNLANKYPDQAKIIDILKQAGEIASSNALKDATTANKAECSMTKQYTILATYTIDLTKYGINEWSMPFVTAVAKDMLKK
jgi:hypothetical protein